MTRGWIGLALIASLISIRLGISVALVEIGVGVVAGNAFGLTTTPWIDLLATFVGQGGATLSLRPLLSYRTRGPTDYQVR